MNRTLIAIGAALIALGIIAGAATFAFSDRWDDDHEVEYRVVNENGQADSDGNVVVVTDDGWRRGPGFSRSQEPRTAIPLSRDGW